MNEKAYSLETGFNWAAEYDRGSPYYLSGYGSTDLKSIDLNVFFTLSDGDDAVRSLEAKPSIDLDRIILSMPATLYGGAPRGPLHRDFYRSTRSAPYVGYRYFLY